MTEIYIQPCDSSAFNESAPLEYPMDEHAQQ